MNTDPRTADAIVSRVQEISPLLESQAAVNDATGRLSDETVEALRDSGVLGMRAPEEYGGANLGPLGTLRVLEAVTYGDASAGWVSAATTIMANVLHFLDEETASKIYADGVPFLAGQLAPGGTAEKVEGGYRVSGRWSYGSGIVHANWVCAAAHVVRGGERSNEMIGFLVPKDQVELAGNWDVVGLRPTGSFDYTITDVHVPEAFSLGDFKTGTMRWGGDATLPGLTGWFNVAQSSWGLGVGRRALDEIAAFARRPAKRGVRLADSEPFMQEYAFAEAQLRSARAWIYETWSGIEQRLADGEPPTTRQLTLVRTGSIYVSDVYRDIATFAFRQGGGTALREGPLQRVFRNAISGGQAVQVSHQMYNHCARELLGEADGMSWRIHELVGSSG